MPITLPPISRRRFLASTAAAAAAGLLSGCRGTGGGGAGAAAKAGRDPNRVALLSDIHIHADPTFVARNVNMADHLRQASSEILALGAGPDAPSAVFVNGDCAYNHGLPEDYAQVAGLVRPLREAGLPVHMGMGNHDARAAFRAAIGQRASGMADREVLVVPTPAVDWVMLDSLNVTKTTPGFLGPAQHDWLVRTLDAPARRNKPVIVMVHHQPQTLPEGWVPPTPEQAGRGVSAATALPTNGATPPKGKPVSFGGLIDTAWLMETLLPRKQVKALLFGHTHVWSHKEEDGLHLVNLPAVAYVFNPAQPSAWVDCRLSSRGATMRLKCIKKDFPKNDELLDLKWRA